MAYQDFTAPNYTEVDVPNVLTIATVKITAVDCDRDIDVYVYKDFGVDYFDALDVDFEVYINTNSLQGAWAGVCGFSDTIDDVNAWEATSIWCRLTKTAVGAYNILLIRGAMVATDTYVCAGNTPYYCTMARDAGNDAATLKIYSDAARTDLLATLNVAGYGADKWRYCYGFSSVNTPSSGKDWDGYIQNLDLNLAAPITVTPPTLALTTTTYAPVLKLAITPSTATLTLTTYIPSVRTGTAITPTTKALTLTTYAPSVISPIKYLIEVSWDNSGNFTEFPYTFPIDFNNTIYSDITADVKTIHFSRGKSDELSKAEVGQLSIILNNDTSKYSPSYSSSVLYGSVLPKRPIRVKATLNGAVYNLFYGFIEEIIPHPHLTEQDCIITAVDGLDFLSRHDMATALYKDALTGTIHGYILDDAGWSATMRTIDTGQLTVPYWYGHDVKARFAQEELDDNEQGFSYINGSGYFCFEDRHHRSTATHQTSQATFTNTMANITYSMNPRNIYNIIKATVTPWTIQSIQELWRLQEEPVIAAGETLTWWGEASYGGQSVFVDTWTTPDATDYEAWTGSGGTGTDMSASLTITTTKFAKTIKLQVKNDAAVPVYLYLLRARGTYYDDQTKVTRKKEDSTSQTAYQKRTLEIDGKYMTSADTAQDYCDYAIGKYKDPRGETSMTIMNKNATMLTQLLTREISDRITVVNTKLGLNGDFFIDHMEHDISLSGKLHTATYRLADCSNEDFWCLGYSAFPSALGVGSQTKLGY